MGGEIERNQLRLGKTPYEQEHGKIAMATVNAWQEWLGATLKSWASLISENFGIWLLVKLA